MRPRAHVQFLSTDADALRSVLDRVDDELLSFGLSPDDRDETALSVSEARTLADGDRDGTPESAVTPALLAATQVDEAPGPLRYARLVGPTVLGRVVREEARGDERVALQCDRREAGVVTEYTVYRYDEAERAYVRCAAAEGVFET